MPLTREGGEEGSKRRGGSWLAFSHPAEEPEPYTAGFSLGQRRGSRVPCSVSNLSSPFYPPYLGSDPLILDFPAEKHSYCFLGRLSPSPS